MKFYELNTLVTLSAAFTRSSDGAVIDPGIVTLYVRQPDGVEVSYAYPGVVTKDSQGNYHYDIPVTMQGLWKYKWEGDYPVLVGSKDSEFTVNDSNLVGSIWPTGAGVVGTGGLTCLAS